MMHQQRRNLVFKIIAGSLPLALLVLFEFVLRWGGYGNDLRLFITDSNDENYWVMNPHVSKRYFPDPATATLGNAERFRKEKGNAVLRIFVLGESTSLGYPYMHNGSFHRMMQYRLLQENPILQTEIINLSLTAVNSITVADFATEISAYSPDAVLIYCGQNEYYGAMGTASANLFSSRPWVQRLLISLRGFRVWQLLQHGWTGLTNTKNNNEVPAQNLMEKMARKQGVPKDSEGYQAGIDQFNRNIRAAISSLCGKGIPVFISNLVSNEKSMAPFADGAGPGSAASLFIEGTKHYKAKDYATAKSLFVQAKEADALRFRAPEAMNITLASIVKQFPKTWLVDTKASFENNSGGGILGEETLLEHVHPNLFGYALLSDCFLTALRKQGIVPPATNTGFTFSTFRASLPVTQVDSIKADMEIKALKMRWPFKDSLKKIPVSNFEEEMAAAMLKKQLGWSVVLDSLLPHYLRVGNYTEALKVAESALLEYPDQVSFYQQAAECSRLLANTSKETTYLQRSFRMQPSAVSAKRLVDLFLTNDAPKATLPYLDYLITNSKQSKALTHIKTMILELQRIKSSPAQTTDRTYALKASELYAMLGYDSLAARYKSQLSGGE